MRRLFELEDHDEIEDTLGEDGSEDQVSPPETDHLIDLDFDEGNTDNDSQIEKDSLSPKIIFFVFLEHWRKGHAHPWLITHY